MNLPSVIVLGGPNGSGKSTAAVRLLRDELQVLEFVNADQIARGLSAFNPENHAVEASRIMLRQLKSIANRTESFAFETTLASRTFSPWLRQLKEEKGYEFRLVYFWLPKVELNIERVARRAALGGHSVPEETIRRRYFRSIQNLFDLYLPLANRWDLFDNTSFFEPVLVASGRCEQEPQIAEKTLWLELRNLYDTGRSESSNSKSV